MSGKKFAIFFGAFFGFLAFAEVHPIQHSSSPVAKPPPIHHDSSNVNAPLLHQDQAVGEVLMKPHDHSSPSKFRIHHLPPSTSPESEEDRYKRLIHRVSHLLELTSGDLDFVVARVSEPPAPQLTEEAYRWLINQVLGERGRDPKGLRPTDLEFFNVISDALIEYCAYEQQTLESVRKATQVVQGSSLNNEKKATAIGALGLVSGILRTRIQKKADLEKKLGKGNVPDSLICDENISKSPPRPAGLPASSKLEPAGLKGESELKKALREYHPQSKQNLPAKMRLPDGREVEVPGDLFDDPSKVVPVDEGAPVSNESAQNLPKVEDPSEPQKP